MDSKGKEESSKVQNTKSAKKEMLNKRFEEEEENEEHLKFKTENTYRSRSKREVHF